MCTLINIMQWWLLLLFTYCLSEVVGISPSLPSFPPLETKSSAVNLQPCEVCQNFVESFKKGMKETARGKHDGGDAYWEESRLGSYADSEVRLVEIQENLCSDVKNGQLDCHQMGEEHESLLEDWWFHHKQNIDLYNYLCIEKLEVCCPYNYYGPKCESCDGGSQNSCSGHGACEGNGTRTGSGKCKCYSGYKGKICSECAIGYHKSNDNESICVPCHFSCKEHCRGPGPLGCEMCATGYHHDPEIGCTDDDECNSSPCETDKFCVNTAGSYHCQSCDIACDTCTGSGPEKCVKCAEDYVLKDGKCINDDDYDEEGTKNAKDSLQEDNYTDSSENKEHREL